MNFLRVIASMDPKSGGPCEGIRNSIPALEKYGHHNEVVCLDAPDAAFLKKENFQVHPMGPSYGPYAYSPKLRKWLGRNLERFDVVIIHGLWLYNNYGTYSFWRNYKRNKTRAPKLYLMPHGMLDPYFQKARERKLKSIRNLIFWQIIEKKAVNGVDGLLFTCEEEMLLARENFKPYLPKRELNVGYGIKTPPDQKRIFESKFKEKISGSINEPYWLYLGRIHPKKGIELLIISYLNLKKKYKKVPDLVIAGPGLETTHGKALELFASAPQIHFASMLEGAEKWGAFYGCELFILPSHQENFGIAVVEAMACGRPVVVSNKVNIWREIYNGKAGIISDNTVEGVEAALEEFINLSKEDRAALGSNALRLYRDKFSVERAAKQMLSCLQTE